MLTIKVERQGVGSVRETFGQPEVTVGRIEGNDLVLDDATVSRRHARMYWQNRRLMVVDLHSDNGTWVNGRKIDAPQEVKEGDVIYVGDFTLRIEDEGDASDEPRADPHKLTREAYEQHALTRAKEKLAALRAGQIKDPPFGREWGTFIALSIFGIPAPLVALGLSLWELCNQWPENLTTLAIICVLCVGLVSAMAWCIHLTWKKSVPTTPQNALTLFYKNLGKGAFDRAASLTLSADFDDFPRYQPRLPNLGEPSGSVFSFSQVGAFDTYWTQLFRTHAWPYCHVSIKKVRATQVADDIVVVDFRARFIRNSLLWLLLVLINPIIALVVDLTTRKVTERRLRKVLIKVSGQWHLLSGDWQGYEEHDLVWLPQETREGSPYRGGVADRKGGTVT